MMTTDGCRRRVLGGEEAAFDQLNPHRLEVIGTHVVAQAGRFILGLRSAFNEERREVRRAKGNPVRHRDRFDAGQAADVLLQLLEEVRHLLTVGVVDGDLHREQVLRLEARINLLARAGSFG